MLALVLALSIGQNGLGGGGFRSPLASYPLTPMFRGVTLDGGLTLVADDGTTTTCFAPAFGLQPEYFECDATGFYLPNAQAFFINATIDDARGYGWNSDGDAILFTPGSASTQHVNVMTHLWSQGAGATASIVPVLISNPDAGAPYGPVYLQSGYNALNTAAVTNINNVRAYPQVRPLRIGFEGSVVGVGVGNFTVEAFDNTSSLSLCVSGNIACTTAIGGTGSSTDCAPYTATSAVGHDIILRMNCGSCTTCPLGNAWVELQPISGT